MLHSWLNPVASHNTSQAALLFAIDTTDNSTKLYFYIVSIMSLCHYNAYVTFGVSQRALKSILQVLQECSVP